MIKFEKFNSDIKNQINKIAEEVFEFEMPVSPKYANTYDYILDDNNKILAAIKPSESYGVKTVSIVRFDLSLTEPKNIVPLKEILNDYEYLLDLADDKRKEIAEAYNRLDVKVRPLVLIQSPMGQPETIKAVEEKLASM